MPPPRSTGLSGMDAQHDFLRARRRATLSRLIARLRGEPDDVGVILPYEEVLGALGFVSERSLGQQVVALETIVGTVDRGRDFDRGFRPTSGRLRGRWEHIAAAMRRGESMPPIDLVRIGRSTSSAMGTIEPPSPAPWAGARSRLRDRGGDTDQRRPCDATSRSTAKEP
jgi:hypothetical protein